MNNLIIETLIKTALKSNMKHKHGCVILYKKKIISKGFNYYKISNLLYNNYTVQQYENNKYSVHAEQNAINKIRNKLLLCKCTIYIIRLKNLNEITIDNNNIELGIPCEACNNLINKYKISIKSIRY